MTDTIEFTTETETTEGGFGNDLMNADDVLVLEAEETESYPDVAGMFRDTAEGETLDPYQNYKFIVHWDAEG